MHFYPPIIDEALFRRVQEKLDTLSNQWQNAHAYRSDYLLSCLVVCDLCEHHYVGTAAKSSRYHYYSCQSYLKRGKAACNASLINRDKLEKAVLEHIHEQILNPENVRRYIELALQQVGPNQEPSAEQKALSKTLEDINVKLRRWEDALERGLLSLDDAAHRIKALQQESERLC